MQSRIQRAIIKKKVAEYRRTSSGGQDLKLQTETNAEYLEDTPKEDILEFVDFDVSATKLSMENRPALARMLKLIENGMISRLVVYERDRLARNVYEYIFMVKKFHKYEVEVVFTALNAPPFSKDLFLETWYGVSAQFEGNRISNRLSDARKRNPTSLIGYKKQIIKKENGTSQRIYKADSKNKDELHDLFYEFSKIELREDIFEVIMKYRKLLDRKEFRIIDILRTPFFAAHYEGTDGAYHKLSNVEPIISLELFKQVQEKLAEFDQGIQQGISLSQNTVQITPTCGKCHSELKFKKGNIGESGIYICSRHRKNSISALELNETIIESVRQVLGKISANSVEKIALKAVNKQIQQLNKQSDELFIQLETLCLKFTSLFKPTDDLNQTKKLQKQIETLREHLSDTQNQIASLQLVKEEVRTLTGLVKKGIMELNEKSYLDLAVLLIANIQVEEDYVLFHYYFSEYFKEGEEPANVAIE